MTNNLTKSNLSPFVNKRIVKQNIDKDFNFKDFISNESNPLPLIPGIYFNSNEKDNIGSKIINNYYTIKICMKNLLLIKTFILSILEVSGVNDLDKINISKEKYKLLKSDLIIPFNDTLSSTFKDQDYFKKFVTLYESQKYGIFKNFNLEIPYFFQIFQVEYNNSPKTFFISLFKKYIDLRKKILIYIHENFGLLAFTSFFDLSDNIDFGMLKNDIRNKNGNNKNEYNEKYNNYVLYGNNINILSNESKINEKKITEKIHSFDYLYNTKFDNAYYKRKHQEIINKNYFELKESINNFIGPDANFDLLSIIKNNLEVDYNTINFIFNYVDPLIYGKAVDSNILIKQFISKKINNFELYYDQYMYWYNNFGKGINVFSNAKTEESNFRKFYEDIFKEINKGNGGPTGPSSGETSSGTSGDKDGNNDSDSISDGTNDNGNNNFKESYIISLELEMIEKLNKNKNYSNNKVNQLINNEKSKKKLNAKYNKKLKNILNKISNNLKKIIIMTPEEKKTYIETLEQKLKKSNFNKNTYMKNKTININRVNNEESQFNSIV
jgi:hypothetical protein